jgi:predicted molibdopterin-dependent oxidoreductase YjgC
VRDQFEAMWNVKLNPEPGLRIPNMFDAAIANVITTDFSDWATNCPEYKVTAVQISPSNGPSDWQKAYDEQARHSRRIAPAEAAE